MASPKTTPDKAKRAASTSTKSKDATVDSGRPWAWIALAVVLLAVIGGAIFAGTRHNATPPVKSSAPRLLAPAAVVTAVADVPAATLQRVGTPKSLVLPVGLLNQTPLTQGGKPSIFFAGADYCSYCGAERWALVQALSRFGSFAHLSLTESAPQDDYPDVQSFSFYGSSYSSPYVVFDPVEIYNNIALNATVAADGYETLQTPSPAEQALINKYDTEPYGQDDGLPFADLGNRFFVKASPFSPTVLQHLTAMKIGRDIQSAGNPVARNIDGSANALTAAICILTKDQPSTVCEAPEIRPIQKLFELTPRR